jgi:cyclic dehypoxanthinyl futalosine synthase
MGITPQQALDCFASDDLVGIGMEADAVRRRLHPEGVVSYIVDRTLDYTGINDPAAIHAAVADTLDLGGTGIQMQGNPHAALTLDWFEQLFSGLKQRFPAVWLHCLSVSEVLALANTSGITLRDTIARLRDAGLDSIPGDARPSALTCPPEDWIGVHRAAHQLGLGTTATMTFGAGETPEQRVAHLETIRALQEETGGFTAFIPLSFQPSAAEREDRTREEPTSVEYLKILAISRMFLDNVPNIQSTWATQGLKVLQMGLRFGSNDVGSVMPEPGASTTEEELRRLIRDAGFRPAQRDTLYRTMFLN